MPAGRSVMSDRNTDSFDELINRIKDNQFEDSSLDVFSEQLRANHARQAVAATNQPNFVVNIQDGDFDSLPDLSPISQERSIRPDAPPPRKRASGGGGKPPRKPGPKRPSGGWSVCMVQGVCYCGHRGCFFGLSGFVCARKRQRSVWAEPAR